MMACVCMSMCVRRCGAALRCAGACLLVVGVLYSLLFFLVLLFLHLFDIVQQIAGCVPGFLCDCWPERITESSGQRVRC